jgi:predicted O-methyltransferase YrrM
MTVNQSTNSAAVVRDVLTRSFPEKELRPQRAFIRAGMSPEELVRLHELVASRGAADVLEVGMGSATSSLVILSALSHAGGRRLTSIDPFQTQTFARDGANRIATAGFGHLHRLIEKPDYLALPELLAAGERFDVVLVDGYHSFDYTLLDVFYADLLLRPGGVLAVHDSSWPAVLATLRFVEKHKDYRRLSPPALVRHDDVVRKALRRVRLYLSGPSTVRAFEDRRRNWHTLAAYQKLSDRMAPEFDLGI